MAMGDPTNTTPINHPIRHPNFPTLFISVPSSSTLLHLHLHLPSLPFFLQLTKHIGHLVAMGEGPCIHVLVVDDCPIDRKVVEKLLLKTGTFTVSIAGSGEKALEILGLDEENAEFANVNDCKIDLILTDYCMPGINGYDLLKAIKDHTSLKAIPVVIMSSENNPERISRCRMTGAEDFVLKPLHLRDIQRLKSYVKPVTPRTKTGTKRKVPLDMMPESNRSERRPRLAGVVA